MNRLKAERWLSQAMDGELSPRRSRKLAAWLEAHPEGEALLRDWKGVGDRLRSAPVWPGQTPGAAWADVQRQMRQIVAEPSSAMWPGRLAWAAAVVVLGFTLVTGVWWRGGTPDGAGSPIARADRTEVEWVESDVPEAVSMVYEDAGTGLTVIWVWLPENGEHDGPAGT